MITMGGCVLGLFLLPLGLPFRSPVCRLFALELVAMQVGQ